MKHFTIISTFTMLAFFLASIVPLAADDHVAIDGYDPVAYFTAETPTKGNASFSVVHDNATWYFASAENRDVFQQNPNMYVPQYGAYCALAVAKGYTASVSPYAWKVVEGKLYLNHSLSVQERWEKDIPGHIIKADKNWPELSEKAENK